MVNENNSIFLVKIVWFFRKITRNYHRNMRHSNMQVSKLHTSFAVDWISHKIIDALLANIGLHKEGHLWICLTSQNWSIYACCISLFAVLQPTKIYLKLYTSIIMIQEDY